MPCPSFGGQAVAGTVWAGIVLLGAMWLQTMGACAQTAATKKHEPSAEEYIGRFGGELVPAGQLVLDGCRMTCGNHPTVLDNNLRDVSAAYAKFTILNPGQFAKLTAPLKFWAYNHACGRQLVGRHQNPTIADCFAVERGVKEGWLTSKGMDELCEFLRPARRTAEGHPTGPERCRLMRKCFAQAGEARR